MFKHIKQFFKAKRNAKFDTSNLDAFIQEISISKLKGLIQQEIKTNNSKYVVYTTYCGSTNNKTFNSRNIVKTDIPHVFISNNQDVLRSAEKSGWTAKFLDLPVYDNVVFSAFQAKIAKALPHIFPYINEHNFSMYLDDKLDFDLNLLPKFEELLVSNNAPLALREHNFLSPNILSEFSEAMRHKRYFAQRQKSINYITNQVSQGLKLNPHKIYLTGAIFRNMRHEQLTSINEEWYEDILRCGTNCQISFDFLSQKYPNIAVLPQKIDK